MYTIYDFEQGSPEWFEMRCGVVTASEAAKILSPTGKPSTQAKGLMYKLAAEAVSKEKHSIEQTEWMARGIEMEEEARNWFEFHSGLEVEQCGFIKRDDMVIGCSPDGLIAGQFAGLEIKCPAPHTHVKYLMDGKLPNDYIPQVQFSMLVTGFKQWHFVSYHPDMKKLHVVVGRDEEWISKMEELLAKFLPELQQTIEKVREL